MPSKILELPPRSLSKVVYPMFVKQKAAVTVNNCLQSCDWTIVGTFGQMTYQQYKQVIRYAIGLVITFYIETLEVVALTLVFIATPRSGREWWAFVGRSCEIGTGVPLI